MTPTSAGWYPDPEQDGQQRYWDGAQWTDLRLPATPSAAPEPGDPAPARSSPQPTAGGGSRTTRTYVAVLVVAFVLLVGGGLAAVVVATRSVDDTAATTDKTDETDETPGPATASEPQRTEAVRPLLFNAGGLLGGSARPALPDGEPGEVSVVQVGPLDTARGIVLLAFRNNTSEGVSQVDFTATARSGGSIVATGSSQGTIPAVVQPGEAGLGFVYFDNSETIPADVAYTFTADPQPIDDEFLSTAPFRVTEATISGGSVVGAATNASGATAEGPFSVAIYCFDGDQLARETGAFAEQDGPILDGGTVTFSADLYGEECSTFVVGVDGYLS